MLKEFKHLILLILGLFIVGSIGYSILEGWNFFDALYMTIITLSTTGFQEIKPLSGEGRVFTMVLIIFGISVFFYVIGNLNVAIFEGNILRGDKMQKKIDQLENHYIICGFGRMRKKFPRNWRRETKLL